MVVKRGSFYRKNLYLRTPLWGIKRRLLILTIPFVLFYFITIIKIFILAFGDNLEEGVIEIHQRVKTTKRSMILDVNGIVLASNLFTTSIYANPRKIIDKKGASRRIHSVMRDLSYNAILKLLKKDKVFVWIKRHVSPKQKLAIIKLGIPGIYFRKDEKRVYPLGNLFSHVVGYVGAKDRGVLGLEKKYNNSLQKNELKTSLDFRIQNIVRSELTEVIKRYKALGGIGIVADVVTGQLLSVVNLPDFDPNNYGKEPYKYMINQAFASVFEVGSVFKLFSIASAIDANIVTTNDSFDISKPLRIGKFTIKDFHMSKNKSASIIEILSKSSNVGMAKIALLSKSDVISSYIEKFGFLDKISVESFDTVAPLSPLKWSDTVLATVSYGYSIAVTPIHVVNAVLSIVNGGVSQELSLVRTKKKGQPFLKPSTSRLMLDMMRNVVSTGTGRRANIRKYGMIGKTGSAEKLIKGKYDKLANTVSFVGVFPHVKPKYIIFVLIDEPHEARRLMTGGVIAAPAVKNIAKQMISVLGISPQKTNK